MPILNEEENGFKKALNVFKKASKKSKPYNFFLKTNSVREENIKDLKSFKNLPVTDKKNYISNYPLKFFLNGEAPPMMHSSSGSSGKPTFWFMEDEQEKAGAEVHQMIFDKIFRIRKDEPTLVVICFAMGVWIAGNYTLNVCRRLSLSGYSLSTITPGIEKENIITVLKNISPNFKNLILAGYPPFIMDVLLEARKQKIEFKNNIKILTAAENFGEDFRKEALNLLGVKDYYNSLINIYGSADAAILGHETPLTIFLREQALLDKKLYEELFGSDSSVIPLLAQYNPNNIFFEENNGELIFTADTAIPLVRYNIHDRGKIILYKDIKKILKKHGLLKKALKRGLNEWRLPFVVVKGRTDVATTIYGLNIYPENIKSGIDNKKVSKFLSGNFIVYKKMLDKSRFQKLHIKLESALGFKPTKKILKLIKKTVIESLIKFNMEFRKLYSSLGKKVLPVIDISRHGDKNFKCQGMECLVQIKGKKPKLVV